MSFDVCLRPFTLPCLLTCQRFPHNRKRCVMWLCGRCWAVGLNWKEGEKGRWLCEGKRPANHH